MALCSHTLNTSKGRRLKNKRQINLVREYLLSMPEVAEIPHFEKTSFRIENKIIAAYDEKNNRLSIKLCEKDQDIFSLIDNSAIYPIPIKWGEQGWTFVYLDKLKNNIIKDILLIAYNNVAPKRLKINSGKG